MHGLPAEADRLMERYARGDDDAFAPLYMIVAPWLAGRVRRLVRDPAAAEDVVQQTFLQAHAARAAFQPGRAVAPWLLVIARRVALDALRRSRRATPLEDVTAPACAPSPLAVVEARELARCVLAALEALPAQLSRAVLITRVGERDNAEAAALLGTTVMGLKMRVHRGVRALRERLDDAGLGPQHRPRGRTRPADAAPHGLA